MLAVSVMVAAARPRVARHWFGAYRTVVACRRCCLGDSIAHGRRCERGRSCRACRRHRARHHARRADGRRGADRERARVSRAHLAPDRERASRTSSLRRGFSPSRRKRRFSYYRIASPLVAGMLESIKAVAAIEVPPRHQPRSAHDEATALRTHLLRPSRRPRRRCDRRCAGRQRVDRAHRRRRRGDGGRRAPACLLRRGTDAAVAQPPHLLPALSRLERAPLSRRRSCRARRSAAAVSSSVGSCASATPARCV